MNTSPKFAIAAVAVAGVAALGFGFFFNSVADAAAPAPAAVTPITDVAPATTTSSIIEAPATTFTLDIETADYMAEHELTDDYVATRFSCADHQEGCGWIQLLAEKDGRSEFWLAKADDNKHFTVSDRLDLGVLPEGTYAAAGWTQRTVEQTDGTSTCDGWYLSVFDNDGVKTAWDTKDGSFVSVSTDGLQVIDSCA